MKPTNAATALTGTRPDAAVGDAWRERAGRLFTEFERPAKAMVRRAYGSALSSDEIEDVYAGAWVGTLRALAGRHQKLTDEEIRSYVLTAVANQAGKEMRRRRRKPTAPLELIGGGIVDTASGSPEERAADAERSVVARDLLASLPPRRRAVMLLRYGWGLEPKQVCELIKGLSPRAYRKEVTKGVDELIQKMRAFERGEWCADREPLLKAFASGLADADQTRQAKAHLSHCRACAEFVARLHGHLHDLGTGAVLPGVLDGIDGHISFADRLHDVGDRLRHAADSLLGRAPPTHIAEPGIQLAGGAGGQLAAVCGGVAAVACVAVIAPGGGSRHLNHERPKPAIERKSDQVRAVPRTPEPTTVLPSQVGNEAPPVAVSAAPTASPSPQPETGPAPTTEAAPSEPVPADEAPTSDFTFGSSAPAPATSSQPPAPSSTTSSSTGGGGSSGGGSSSAGDFAFGQ